MDVLSDVLNVVRLSGAVFFTAEFSAPWCSQSHSEDELAKLLAPNAECLAFFHIVAKGQCWIGMEDREPFLIEEGDVVVFPRADVHTFSDEPGRPPVSLDSAFENGVDEVIRLEFGGGGEKTTFVCGYLSCEQRFAPLFDSLPSVIHVRSKPDDDEEVPGHVGRWLSTSLRFLIQEALSPRPGNDAVCARLTELFFVELMRDEMARASEQDSGWLAGLNDPQVGRAIEIIHKQPAHPWTVEGIAHEVGVSRSVLAERFTQLVGHSPMRYLTDWRMRLAQNLLRESDKTLADIGSEVGYESEAAFSRAFKREIGEPPATWRKQHISS